MLRVRVLRRFLPVALALLAGWLSPLPAAASPPRSVVEKLVSAIRSYDSSAGGGSRHNAEVSRTAHAILDIDQLARRSLDGQWAKLHPSQRKAFVSLLKELLEKIAYPKSAKFFKGLDLTIDGEEVNGRLAKVKTHVVHEEEGEVEIEFQLARARSGWVVRDIYLDGVSLATNVRTQIQRVIADESFDGLVKRMREKLEDS